MYTHIRICKPYLHQCEGIIIGHHRFSRSLEQFSIIPPQSSQSCGIFIREHSLIWFSWVMQKDMQGRAAGSSLWHRSTHVFTLVRTIVSHVYTDTYHVYPQSYNTDTAPSFTEVYISWPELHAPYPSHLPPTFACMQPGPCLWVVDSSIGAILDLIFSWDYREKSESGAGVLV